MFFANNRVFTNMNKDLSRKFTSLKWEAKKTYLGMPALIYYLHKFIQKLRHLSFKILRAFVNMHDYGKRKIGGKH